MYMQAERATCLPVIGGMMEMDKLALTFFASHHAGVWKFE
jgi:hypothetical protein